MRDVWLRNRKEHWLFKGHLKYVFNRCPYILLKSVLPRAARINYELYEALRVHVRVDGDDFQGVQDDSNERILRDESDSDKPITWPKSHHGRLSLD